MNEPEDSLAPPPVMLPAQNEAPLPAEIVVAKPAGNRGFAKLAWGVILTIAAIVIGLNAFARDDDGDKPNGAAPEGAESFADTIAEFQGKLFVGWQAFNESLGAPNEVAQEQKEGIYEQVQELDEGPPSSRLRFVALAGELAGPVEAVDKLNALKQQFDDPKSAAAQPSQTERDLLAAMSKLYADYAQDAWEAPSLSAAERQSIANLGWFGRLALAPAEGSNQAAREAVIAPAKNTFIMLMLLGLGGLAALAAGTAGAFVFLVLIASKKVRPSVVTPSGNGGIYAETFAWWMAIFMGAQIAGGLAFQYAFDLAEGEEPPLAIAIVIFLFGLVALYWPVLRGIPWSQVRRDIGWTAGRSPLLEPLYGVVGYVCTLPLMAIGVIVVTFLVQIANSIRGNGGPPATPTHPIVEWIGQGGWGQVAVIFILASICAPLIEETFFRGVLYRHLRDATWRWRVGASVLFSSLANGILFAAIHPQGLLAVPALGAIALGLSLQREWRESLIAPMVSHGLNNGVMLVLLVVITS